MTTTVTVKAHCADNVKVEVLIWEGHEDPEGPEVHYLNDGEVREFHVYDARSIDVREFEFREVTD